MSQLLFNLLSSFFGLSSMLMLLYYIKYKRYLVLKASFWFSLFFFVQIQLYSFLFSNRLYDQILDHFIFIILTQILPFISLIFTGILLNKETRDLWEVSILTKTTFNSIKLVKGLMWKFFILSLIILCIYLYFVPFKKTGFYMVFFSNNPLAATIAREKSLKLLPYEWLKYLYQFFARFLSLFIGSAIIVIGNYESKIQKIKPFKKIINFSIYTSIILILMIGSILPGARVGAVLLMLCMAITYFILSGEKINLIKYLLLASIILIPAMLTQFFKYGLSIEDSFSVVSTIFERIMSVPVTAGIKWLNYVSYYETIGVRGLSLFAFLDDRPFVHVPNLMMNHYFHFTSTQSGYLTTSFVFAYYCYLGNISFPIILLLIQFLDTWIILYKYIRTEILLPTIVALNMAAINLTGSEYFQAFITYGYFTGLLFIVLIDKIFLNIKLNKR